jgi:NADPH-dependent 2,4-dienoyl-CoA reductase/sulfur reductase-like enzyme
VTDLAIVGAGPAGMVAAIEARRLDLAVTLVDEQPRPGGQIYRCGAARDDALEAALGPEYRHGMGLIERFAACGADYRPARALWDLSDGRLSLSGDGKAEEIAVKQVILATGAMERPVPIPGWTLPGVMSVGAAQILLKTAGAAPREPVVMAGSGPLLYLLASQYLAVGVPIRALVETSPANNKWSAGPHILGALWQRKLMAKGLAMLSALRRAGVKRYMGARHLRVEGRDACQALAFEAGGAQRIETGLVLLHEGVIPNTHVSMAVRAAHDWDTAQLCWKPRLGAWGETTVDGIAVAGDGGGIQGAEAAEHLGRIVALGAAHRLGAIDASTRDRAAAAPRAALKRLAPARRFIDALYRPATEQRVPPDDATLVCRCEEVTAGEIRRVARIGAIGLTQAKAYTRCGMGPCQGRLCGPTVAALVADERQMAEADVPPYRPRPPYKPLTLGAIASLADPSFQVVSAAEGLFKGKKVLDDI